MRTSKRNSKIYIYITYTTYINIIYIFGIEEIF